MMLVVGLRGVGLLNWAALSLLRIRSVLTSLKLHIVMTVFAVVCIPENGVPLVSLENIDTSP